MPNALGQPNLFHDNENETKLTTCKILQDIGISPRCKQKSISSIHTLSTYTDQRFSGRGVNHLKQATLDIQSASLAIQESNHR